MAGLTAGRRREPAQVLQRDAVHILVDDPVQPRPEPLGAAQAAAGAFLGVGGQAGDGGELPLDGAQNLPGGVLGGGPGQAVPALAAPAADHQPRPGQRRDDLLQIFQADALPLADRFQGHKLLGFVAGQLQHQPQRIANPWWKISSDESLPYSHSRHCAGPAHFKCLYHIKSLWHAQYRLSILDEPPKTLEFAAAISAK